MIEVLDGGALTTVQDHPGRVGYWHVGVPPSGPMDTLSHRLVNAVLANRPDAAALELTGSGPTLRAHVDTVVAIGGAAMTAAVDGRAVPHWHPIQLPAGSTLRVGAVRGCGLRCSLAVRGGIDVPDYLGSRSTFLLAGFGGHEGRALRTGDRLVIGDRVVPGRSPAPLPPGLAPVMVHDWELGVLVGPHTAPDFLTSDGLAAMFAATWEVHHNSARTGIRLIGPKPRWARADGGEAGLHPSNIHDTGYAIGAIDLTGDMPVVLGPDGPSLGGFVCPAVVAAAERWKLGQLSPGDTVRLVPWSQRAATEAERHASTWIERAGERIEPLARPSWNAATVRDGDLDDAVLRVDRHEHRPRVTYRQAGDRFVLVEFGENRLDLELRVGVHALDTWVGEHLGDRIVDATAGVRSLLVQLDPDRLDVPRAVDAIAEGVDEVVHGQDPVVASRIVHLPLSWDDPATREAIERYMNGVRPDAPWCPWNIEFIRRINGLDSVEDVHRIVHDASYLVLGLGDVYLGAPVATPLDPRHRLVTTKYNPARTWTPENAVGIGGAYLCIYGMEGPGGYQFVGRTVKVWDRSAAAGATPWLLRTFDQIRWQPVEADELLELRARQLEGRLELDVEASRFSLAEHRSFLEQHREEIDRFGVRQRRAFRAERDAWQAAGEFAPGDPDTGPTPHLTTPTTRT